MGISVGGEYLKHSVVNGEEGNVEGSSTKVEDEDIGLSSGLIHTVSNGGGGGLVDNTPHLHSSNGSGVLGSLTLGIVEVGGYGDDGIIDFFAEEDLRGSLHFLKDHGGNLLRCELGGLSSESDLHHGLILIADNLIGHEFLIGLNRLIGIIPSNETLDIKDGVFGVDSGLILGGISGETVTVVHECNIGGSDAVSLVVGDNLDAAVLEHSDTGVSRSEIDTNYGSHFFFFLSEGEGGGHEGQCGDGKILEDHGFF
mmetsp:Transcript_1021/g.1515  ORF Transcript_1021/g.1515 Transcript_1021/m.1515 type:complete len:255 (-) Transcript_1021:40-804(-)